MPATDSTASRDASHLEIVPAEDCHAEVVAEFIRQVWTSTATAQSVLAGWRDGGAKNLAEPGVTPPTWIALKSGRCLGYVTTIPMRLWNGSEEAPAYWIKGLMVLPEFRGGPIGFLLLKAAAARLPLSGGLAVAPPARRLFEALGYRDLGPIPNYVQPIAPHRILSRLDGSGAGFSSLPRWATSVFRMARSTGLATAGGWTAGVALRATAAARRLSALGISARLCTANQVADRLDELWQSLRTGFSATAARSAPALLQHYAGGESPYVWVSASSQGRLSGVAVLRRPRPEGDERLHGLRVAILSEMLYPPARPGAGLALLGAAADAARELGAEAILASASAPELQQLLKRQWYVPLAGNVHFLFRDKTGKSPGYPGKLAEWWLTRGDGSADDSF